VGSIGSDEPAAEVSIVLGPKPDPAIACTLAPDAMPDRLADWRALLDRARARIPMSDGGLRVELGADVSIEALARLVAAEQGCCAFFSFAITVDSRGTALEVRAPEDASEIVTALFGAPQS
jgi:hypothetical protein